jgi:hypothetical protein
VEASLPQAVMSRASRASRALHRGRDRFTA